MSRAVYAAGDDGGGSTGTRAFRYRDAGDVARNAVIVDFVVNDRRLVSVGRTLEYEREAIDRDRQRGNFGRHIRLRLIDARRFGNVGGATIGVCTFADR